MRLSGNVRVSEVPPGTSLVKDRLEKMGEEISKTGYVLFGNSILGTIFSWLASHLGQILFWGSMIGLTGITLWGAWQTASTIVDQVRNMAPVLAIGLIIMMFMMLVQPLMSLMSSFGEMFGG